MNKIFLGTDHAGYDLKEKIKEWLTEWGFEYEDKGAYSFDPTDDYPDFIREAASAVAKDPEQNKGIVLGGGGQGEAVAANRFKGIVTCVYYGGNLDVVRVSREHNNSNVLSLGARFVGEEEAKKAIKLWLDTEFSGAKRHIRRLNKIDPQS